MSTKTHNANEPHRHQLLPVAITIFGLYVTIMSVGYFVGNML